MFTVSDSPRAISFKFGHETQINIGRIANRQMPISFPISDHRRHGLIEIVNDLAGAIKQPSSRTSEFYVAVCAARITALPKLLFQAFYRPAQPRLRNVQAILGRPRKVQLFAHGNETLQPVEINIYFRAYKPLRPSYSSCLGTRAVAQHLVQI